MTVTDWHEWLTRLAVEAGADPERARERMAQAAHVAGALPPACPYCAFRAPEIRAVTACGHCGRGRPMEEP